MHHLVLAAELSRCRCSYHHYGSSGSGYGDYLVFSWLWREIRWWSLLVYMAIVVAFAMLRAAFGGSDC